MEPARKRRALQEPLYVMERPSADHFIIMGNRGVPYDVRQHSGHGWTCTCMDYVQRSLEDPQHQCKHIWFLHLRVLKKNGEESPTMPRSVPKPPVVVIPVTPSFTRRWTPTDECPICFEAMEEEGELRFCVRQCGRPIHLHCFLQWKQYHRARGVPCPYCRTPMEP